MAPILIDNRGLIKLGSIAALTIILVFAGGFFAGYQRATVIVQADSELENLALPLNENTTQSDIEPRTPEIIAQGVEIDVDQPEQQLSNSDIDTEAEKNDLTIIADTNNNVASENLKETHNKDKVQQTGSTKTVLETAMKKPPLSLPEKKVLPGKTPQENVARIDQDQQTLTTAFTSVELHKIKYSIQVAVSGTLGNAEKMMKKMHAQQLDAYITDYTNSRNEVRYNVRFGYFIDKKTALSRLKEYKSNLKGDGYLVNFSAKNIVDVAGTGKIKPPVSKDKVENKPVPDAKLSELEQGKLSQAHVLSAQKIAAN